ncbi:MAG: FprA family A-type flavoprotein [Armatimonadota bacterium]
MTVVENIRSSRTTFKAIPVSEHVYWVGAVDWDLRDFHGYATERGTTYNAYLVLGEKIALIDTVKAPFKDEMLARIASVIDPERIDYIISNHAEMDHSGCLPQVMETTKPEKVFASCNGVLALANHFHFDRSTITPIKEAEPLSLGNLTLSFIETRMLHWPDSMFTYLVEEGLLFSNDAFGMHLASAERFDDEICWCTLEEEAAKYYANILMPYSPLISKLLEKVAGMNLALNMIAPDHGPIWRRDMNRILELYGQWAAGKPKNKAVIVYDTMWDSTAKMARAMCEGLMSAGTPAQLMSLKSSHRSDVVTQVLGAGALLVGSPTLNNNMLPTVADVLTYLKGLRPTNLIGASFGSFGWGGEAVGQVREMLTAMKVDIVNDGVKIKYVPDNEALAQCFDLGVQVAQTLQARLKEQE